MLKGPERIPTTIIRQADKLINEFICYLVIFQSEVLHQPLNGEQHTMCIEEAGRRLTKKTKQKRLKYHKIHVKRFIVQ